LLSLKFFLRVEKLTEKQLDRVLCIYNAIPRNIFYEAFDAKVPVMIGSLQEAIGTYSIENYDAKIQRIIEKSDNQEEQPRKAARSSSSRPRFVTTDYDADFMRLETKKKLSIFFIDKAAKSQYCAQNKPGDSSCIKDVANAMFCGFHCENRTAENLATHMVQDSQRYGTAIEKRACMKDIEDIINNELSGLDLHIEVDENEYEIQAIDDVVFEEIPVDLDDEDNIIDEDEDTETAEPTTTFHLRSKDNKVEHIKMTNVRLRKVCYAYKFILTAYSDNNCERSDLAKYDCCASNHRRSSQKLAGARTRK